MTVHLEGMPVEAGDHVVQFYDNESELARTVGAYLSDAVQVGAVAIAIATDAHRRAFERQLEEAGIDPSDCRRDGRLVWLDAPATMAAFMSRGRIDGEAFRRVIGPVIRRAAATGRPVRAYGEMVAVLWEAGDVLGAIDLEQLWNDLGLELEFSLLCAYPSEFVHGDDQTEALRQVCHLHSSVWRGPNCDDQDVRNSVETAVSARFSAELDAPRAARHFVADAVRGWGHSGSFVDDVQLVITELATNAVRHARAPFSVVARPAQSGVRVSVGDPSLVKPTLRVHDPLATSGRGLFLVAAIATTWGVELTADGKTVWAELQP